MATYDAVICGAGIAGVATAHELSVRRGLRRVLVADDRAPLTLTSDKSTECYRNWWPGPDGAMVQLMNTSIDRLEELADESENRFKLNRRGYVYATRDLRTASEFRRSGAAAEDQGAGPLRIHDVSDRDYREAVPEGYERDLTGADLLIGNESVRRHFPYLSQDVVAVLHARRCGWLSGQQLGMYLLEEARGSGVEVKRARVTAVDVQGGRVRSVLVGAERVTTDTFIDAAGPFVRDVAALAGSDLPVFSELHLKVNFRDVDRVVPRGAPLVIWSDPQQLEWTDAEREALRDSEVEELIDRGFPAGAHLRPEGREDSDFVLMLWPYHTPPVEPRWPLPVDPAYQEIVLRGLSEMIPDLRNYLGRASPSVIDGGYYTKTRENRPLIGRLDAKGAFVVGAFSGFGIMAALGAADLLARQMLSLPTPSYTAAFDPARYDDASYRAALETWDRSGQL
jgi:sarcosine oxidase, subunit beta